MSYGSYGAGLGENMKFARRYLALTAYGVALLVCAAASAWGSNSYYVDNQKGNDSSRGTETAPFRTIKKGVSVLKPGDKLLLRAGVYDEYFTSNTIPGSTSWEKAITSASYPGEQAVIMPQSGPSVYRVFSFNYASQKYIVLDGLVLDGTNVIDHVVKITYTGKSPENHAGHIRIINCEIRNAPHSGIFAGLGLDGGYNEFINLNVHHNGRGKLDHGFYISGSNNLITKCHIHDNTGYGVQIYCERSRMVNNNTITSNRIHDNATAREGGAGIILSSGTGNRACYNVIWKNQGGIRIDYGASNSEVYNNTMYANSQFGIFVGPDSINSRIKNNLLFKNTTTISDNSRSASLSNNLTTDPGFVDAEKCDFHLKPGSQAIAAGTDVGLTRDCEDKIVPRGGAPGIGAYEYSR